MTDVTDDDLILSFDGDDASYCIDLPGIGRVCLGAAEHDGGADFRPSQAAIAKLRRIKSAVTGACTDGSCRGGAKKTAPRSNNDVLQGMADTLAGLVDALSPAPVAGVRYFPSEAEDQQQALAKLLRQQVQLNTAVTNLMANEAKLAQQLTGLLSAA